MPPRPVQAPKLRAGDRGPGLDDRRRKLLLYAFAASGVVALIIVLGVIFIGGGSSSNAIAGTMTDAGCTYRTYVMPPPIGDMHVTSLKAKPKWVTNPPSGGQHYYQWALWNFYDQPVIPVQAVHNLEHGGIVIWYGEKISAETKAELRAFYDESPIGMLATPYPGLGTKIALAAWTGNPEIYQTQKKLGFYGNGHLSVCTGFDKKAFTAFRDTFRGHGPEGIPLSSLLPGT
jgi:hypothetical protein